MPTDSFHDLEFPIYSGKEKKKKLCCFAGGWRETEGRRVVGKLS